MEIYERKVTTRKALEELKTLVEQINEKLSNDVGNFSGKKDFFCRVTVDNGRMPNDLYYNEWVLTVGNFKFCDGELKICIRDNQNEHEPVIYSTNNFRYIEKIHFGDMFEALKEAIEIYNENAKEKDEQIERFLKIASQF